MKKMSVWLLQVAFVVVLAWGLTACDGGGGNYNSGGTCYNCGSTGGGTGGGNTDPFYHAWYDVYGTYCYTGYPKAGCNFFFDGDKITASEDPYYSYGHSLTYATWLYTDSWGYSRQFVGYGWLSNSGIVYDQYGRALNETDEAEASLDIIEAAAQEEQQMVEQVGKAFAEKYALAEDAGVKVAKALNEWATLGKKRARTAADIADFSKRLYGVDIGKAASALAEAQTGSTAKMEAVNEEIAKNWGTNAETSKQILRSWYKSQASQFGL